MARVVIQDTGMNQGNSYHSEGTCEGIPVTLDGKTNSAASDKTLHGTGGGEMKAIDGSDSIKFEGEGETDQNVAAGKEWRGTLKFAVAATGARFAFLNNKECTYTCSEEPNGKSKTKIYL
jgi:hypothetical protein